MTTTTDQSVRIMQLEQKVGDQQGLINAMADTLRYARKEIIYRIGNAQVANSNAAVMSIDEVLKRAWDAPATAAREA